MRSAGRIYLAAAFAFLVFAGRTLPAQPPDGAAAVAPSSVPDALRSPRATMGTFLDVENAGEYSAAAACLDFSGTSYTPAEQEVLARRLKDVIDRMQWVDLAKLSAAPDGSPFHFPTDTADPPITIARSADGAWRFTPETVARIEALYESWKDKPLKVPHTPWYRQPTPVGNEVWRIVALFASLLLAWIIGRVLKSIFNGSAASLERRERRYAAVTLRALGRAAVPFFLVLGLKTGLSFLLMVPVVQSIADTVTTILFTIAVGYVIFCLVDVIDTWLTTLAAKTESKLDDMLAPMVRTTLKATIVILVLVQIATILSDKPMTSVIAGLGVGSIAVGLAAQDMIKNFFGSLMIFSDRPFELGEYIEVDGQGGAIEVVGFRSTRLRTHDGHLIVIPNGTLANATVKNIGKRPFLRRILDIGITYDTPPEKLHRAIEIVKEILSADEVNQPENLPRVHFTDFSDSTLNIKIIYWHFPPDWMAFTEFNQQVNFQILERFNAERIDFAFPTQTIQLNQQVG